jgi:transmembrane sensor
MMNKHYPEYHDYLRIGKLADSLNLEEEDDFQQLIATNSVFRDAFLQLKQELPDSTLELLSKFKDDNEWQPIPENFRSEVPVRRLRWLFAAAAAVILLIGTVAVFLTNKEFETPSVVLKPNAIQLKLANGKTINLSDSKGTIDAGHATINNSGETLTYNVNSNENSGMNSLTIAPGEDYQITLGDGSKVWLNSTTRMDFPFNFSGSKREIFINGEAYLKVAKDSRRPFIINMPEGSVEVLGTEFNINTYDTGVIKISLVEGSVKFSAPLGNIKLRPGRQGVYLRNQNISEQPFDNRRTLSWRKGIFYFNESPLTEIIKIIPRWYNIKGVVIDNSRNNNKRIVGAIDRTKPLEVFLTDLKDVSDINSYFDRDGVLHFK